MDTTKKIPLFTEPAPFALFLDLDGVFAGFDEKFFAMTGKWPHQVEKKQLWKVVNSVDDYFYSLPLMADADHLWAYCKQYTPQFLTGLPMKQNGREQKVNWVIDKFGSEWTTHVVPKRDKQLFSGPNKVLIDDTIVNIEQWTAKGGMGVLHRDVWETITHLEELRLSY